MAAFICSARRTCSRKVRYFAVQVINFLIDHFCVRECPTVRLPIHVFGQTVALDFRVCKRIRPTNNSVGCIAFDRVNLSVGNPDNDTDMIPFTGLRCLIKEDQITLLRSVFGRRFVIIVEIRVSSGAVRSVCMCVSRIAYHTCGNTGLSGTPRDKHCTPRIVMAIRIAFNLSSEPITVFRIVTGT